jgi:hypothetical protein
MNQNSNLLEDTVVEDILRSILVDYEIIFNKRINQDIRKEFLIDPKKNTCRFCKKSFPETTFKRKSHSIPEFMGNKTVISKYECDTCNELYFNLFENELSNFMQLFHTLSGIKGKKNKIPKYKLKGEPIIEHLPDIISISGISETRINKKSKNCFEMPFKIPTYIPEYVYRCLVKICISLIPHNNLPIYQGTIDWLMNLNQKPSIKPYMIFTTYPNKCQIPEVFAVLLARKDNCDKNIPHSIFFLSYDSYAFQTYLPYSSKEKLNVDLKVFPYEIPTMIDLNPENRKLKESCIIDLSSRNKIKNENITVTVTGDLIEREIKNPKR